MSLRSNVTEVRKIIDTDIPDDRVEAFLKSASVMVDQALGKTTLLSEESKTEIEKFLTAHFIASTVTQQLAEAGGGVTRVKFQGEFGQGLKSTAYGQAVLRMDTTGILAQTDKDEKQQLVFISLGGDEA